MNLSGWIERQADFASSKTAIHFENNAISYAALEQRVTAIARMLKHELAVSRGDRVAFLGLNSPDFLALIFATARLGAMLVPFNWRLAPPEHSYILQDAGIDVLIAESEFVAGIDQVRDKQSACKFVAQGKATQAWLEFDELINTASGDDSNPHVDYANPLLIVYTSGTTGHPKGAVLTQETLLWNALNSLHMHDLSSQDHVLNALPMFHVGGLNIQTLPALYTGATVTLHRRFEPEAVLTEISQSDPTLTVLVPATLRALIQHPHWQSADLSSLRCITTGSSSVPNNLITPFHERGIPVIQVYGSTETAPIAIYQRPKDAETHLGSTGKPALHCEIRIVDELGDDVSIGSAGEILVRGPNVMYEYWGNEAATQESLHDGWFYTGDIGHKDSEGYYYIDDRKKDVIVSGGENIYPAELEQLLQQVEGVNDVAVVARIDVQWGEIPVAVIEKKADAELTADQVLAIFEGRLARYKHPREVVFMDELPRNAMGKVQKFKVREIFAR